jgi:glycosyltransferase involved in cell wall biosynthesis
MRDAVIWAGHSSAAKRIGALGLMVGLLARAANAAIIGGALLWAGLARSLRPRPWRPNGCVVAVGTFYSRNWLVAHAAPLSRCGIEKLVVVADRPLGPFERVSFACPPAWLSRLIGRALAKLVWLLRVGLRERPDLFIGYYVMPSGVAALLAARLFGRSACYQMTGGPLEIVGGGWATENSLQKALGGPSLFIERLARRLVAAFDLVVVRGPRARDFVADCGASGRIAIIPGSVDADRLSSTLAREHDLIYVGRLTAMKRPLQFLDVVAGVREAIPGVRAVLVGDGPMMAAVRARVAKLGLTGQVELRGHTEEVEPLLRRSRVFVLTSESEGLPIAVAEAMAAGVVPVVSEVGELAELVQDGENGYLVPVGDVPAFIVRSVRLLSDAPLWAKCSQAAAAAARRSNHVEVVAGLWAEAIPGAVARAGAAGQGAQAGPTQER